MCREQFTTLKKQMEATNGQEDGDEDDQARYDEQEEGNEGHKGGIEEEELIADWTSLSAPQWPCRAR